MSNAALDAVAVILDHLQAVIEGDANEYPGTPGARSLYAPMSVAGAFTCSGTQALTTLVVDSTGTLPSDRRSWARGLFVRDAGPPVFAIATTSPAGSTPVGEVRRVTGYAMVDVPDLPNPPIETHTWTVANLGGWSALPGNGTTQFRLLEGFKRSPNLSDINDAAAGVPGGFDRFFSLNAGAGKELEIYGKGLVTLEAEVDVRLRLTKAGRRDDTVASAMENALILRNSLCHSRNRPIAGSAAASYFRALLPGSGGTQIETNDKHKVVTLDRLRLLYRASNEYSYSVSSGIF